MDYRELINKILSVLTRQNNINTPSARIEEITAGLVVTTYYGYPKRNNSATSAAEWAIQKLIETDDGAGTITTVREWAGGDIAKSNIWDNRSSLTYAYFPL